MRSFTFRREAIWLLVLSLIPLVAILGALVVQRLLEWLQAR